jgi:hypothetical protein
MLGYTIERVDSVDANGLAWDTTYDVFSADGNSMLGGEHPTPRRQNSCSGTNCRGGATICLCSSQNISVKTSQLKTSSQGRPNHRRRERSAAIARPCPSGHQRESPRPSTRESSRCAASAAGFRCTVIVCSCAPVLPAASRNQHDAVAGVARPLPSAYAIQADA